jgi:hypothetical protein
MIPGIDDSVGSRGKLSLNDAFFAEDLMHPRGRLIKAYPRCFSFFSIGATSVSQPAGGWVGAASGTGAGGVGELGKIASRGRRNPQP